MKIAVIDDERPARRELIHQILEVLPGSTSRTVSYTHLTLPTKWIV